MEGLNVLTAAPWRITIGGAEYWMQPLKLDDWALIEKRLLRGRRDPIEVAKESLDGLAPDEKRTLLDAALSQAANRHKVTAEELIGYTATPAGTALMFWLSIRKRHPEITEDRAAELLNLVGDEQLGGLHAEIEGRGGIPEDPAKK